MCYFQVYSKVIQLYIYVKYDPKKNIYVYIYKNVYIYVLLQILFHLGYYNILNIVPCAIQSALVVYLFYI